MGYSPRDIKATFNYYKDLPGGESPSPIQVNVATKLSQQRATKECVIHDIRGREDEFKLDSCGFQIVKQVSVEKDFLDDDHIEAVYYPEMIDLLKKHTGAKDIHIFDHTIRRQAIDFLTRVNTEATGSDPAFSATDLAALTAIPKSQRGPLHSVHIDQSYAYAPECVRHNLPDIADDLLKCRYQIINVWRPLKTVVKDPFAVCDARSVAEEDLVPIKLVYPAHTTETFAVRPNEAHRWHYLSNQQPDEVLMLKCFDSKTDGRARRVPHSAFVDEAFKDEAARQSIEVRALVFYDEEE